MIFGRGAIKPGAPPRRALRFYVLIVRGFCADSCPKNGPFTACPKACVGRMVPREAQVHPTVSSIGTDLGKTLENQKPWLMVRVTRLPWVASSTPNSHKALRLTPVLDSGKNFATSGPMA